MKNNLERLLSYILELGLDYRCDPDRDVIVIRTEKRAGSDMYGRFYLSGGDEIVELPVSCGLRAGKELIDTALQLSRTFT